MAQKNKAKEGNGAATKGQTAERRDTQEQRREAPEQRPEAPEQRRNMPMQRPEPSRMAARRSEHPLSRLRDEMDTLFNRFFGNWPTPWVFGSTALEMPWERFWDVDAEDTDKEVVVRAEAPGFEPKDFDVHINGNNLVISAEHKQESEESEGEYRTWQQRYGRFERSIPLPAEVHADQVEARYRNGILEVRLPRAEEAQRKRIEVKG